MRCNGGLDQWQKQSNRLPRTLPEAERFLWHAAFHISNVRANFASDLAHEDAKRAEQIIGAAIELCQSEYEEIPLGRKP